MQTFEEFEQHEIDLIVDFIENMIEAHLTVVEKHDVEVELVNDEFSLNITNDGEGW
jgi:hypothetical protein